MQIQMLKFFKIYLLWFLSKFKSNFFRKVLVQIDPNIFKREDCFPMINSSCSLTYVIAYYYDGNTWCWISVLLSYEDDELEGCYCHGIWVQSHVYIEDN